MGDLAACVEIGWREEKTKERHVLGNYSQLIYLKAAGENVSHVSNTQIRDRNPPGERRRAFRKHNRFHPEHLPQSRLYTPRTISLLK